MNNRTTIMIALLAVVMMVGPASAAVTGIALTDGDDDKFFYGEEITLTWNSDNPKSYIWINSTGESWGAASDDNTSMHDNKNTAMLNGTSVSGSGGTPFTYTYTFANHTVNESAQAWVVYINDTSNAAMPGTCANESFVMNSYNVSLRTGRSAAEGNSTLAGDTIKVSVTTSGMLAKTERDGLGITITLPEGGNTVSGDTNVAETGNYTFNITAAKAGVGVFKNITLNYGSFSWNSAQLEDYSGWGSATNTQFNVSELNLKAYDINGTADCDQNITSVNVITKLGGATIPANLSYPVNITLMCDLSNVEFNSTGTSDAELNLTIPAGTNESSHYGNYSIPANATLTLKVTSETSGTITATVNTSGEAWTDGFVIHPDTEHNVLTAPSVATSYQIGELVNITGWNSTGAAPMLNITDPTGALINTTVVVLNPTDSSFEYTWDTNLTWNTMQTVTWNATRNKTGTYTLKLGNESSTYDEITITLSEDIIVTPSPISIPVNGTLWINGTTDRRNSNGTFMNCTISTESNRGGDIINSTLSKVINDFSAATGLATYSILWNSSDNLAGIVASAAPVSSDTFDETYHITVNDSAAKETAATFHITDSITVNPATGVPGRNFTVTGTSARTNGTNISVTIQTVAGLPGRTNYTTVQGNAWNITMNASTLNGAPLTPLESYYIIANDSIVKDTATLTLGEGTIDFEVIPADTTMDGIVWFNGTTDMGAGTIIRINVTNATGVLFNTTMSDHVEADQTFNVSWQVNTSLITGNFTAPVEQCNVVAYNDTIYSTTKTLNVTEYLVITTSDFEIATGGEFKIEGTLNRVDGTTVEIDTASIGGTPTNSTDATVYGGEFNRTLYARFNLGGDGDLPAGEYTITVKDGTNASASIIMTVAVKKVTLDNPADGATYNVNDTIPIDGTSNIGNNTNISVLIQRTSGPEEWKPFTTTLYGTTNFTGYWSTEWNTSADLTFQALDTKPGDYLFLAQNGTEYASMHTITIAAVPTVDMIVVDPAGSVSLANVTDTKQFNATCKNGTTELPDITVTWASSNVTVGTIDASGLFTAAANGTTNVTATAEDVTSDTVTVTVGEAGVTGDVTNDGSVNVLDMIRVGQHWGETGTSGWIPEDVKEDGEINVLDMILIGQHWTG